jgi:dihydrofolate synthase/folylpolyglutamate synthase
MMDYNSAVEYLESLIDYERTVAEARQARFFNLDRIRLLLEKLGNPQDQLNCLHIAGTKGKGSTAAMLAAIICQAGYRVGLFSSPHLVSFRERIRIDNELIAKDKVSELTERLRPYLEALRGSEIGSPSFFEAYTAIALVYFAKEKVDFVVLETGLGGRLDATNIVNPRVCGVTTIAMDHMAELGNSLEKIAGEKAGIIKPARPVVCAPQALEVIKVIGNVCLEKGAPLLRVGAYGDACEIQTRSWEPELTNQRISIKGRHGCYEGMACLLIGEHQAKNAGVAVGMAEVLIDQGWDLDENAIRNGIEKVNWLGRMQILHREHTIVFDVAHDAASAKALAQTMRALFPDNDITLILGIYSDKDIENIAVNLCPIAKRIILTSAEFPRMAKTGELLKRIEPARYTNNFALIPDVEAALKEAQEKAKKDGIICVTGGLYIVGKAMVTLGLASPD